MATLYAIPYRTVELSREIKQNTLYRFPALSLCRQITGDVSQLLRVVLQNQVSMQALAIIDLRRFRKFFQTFQSVGNN